MSRGSRATFRPLKLSSTPTLEKSPVNMDFSQASAIICATRAASEIGLPLTVYRNADSGGWWYTNSLASCLTRSEVHATFLPTNYFQ
jgi:hypothetical protein